MDHSAPIPAEPDGDLPRIDGGIKGKLLEAIWAFVEPQPSDDVGEVAFLVQAEYLKNLRQAHLGGQPPDAFEIGKADDDMECYDANIHMLDSVLHAELDKGHTRSQLRDMLTALGLLKSGDEGDLVHRMLVYGGYFWRLEHVDKSNTSNADSHAAWSSTQLRCADPVNAADDRTTEASEVGGAYLLSLTNVFGARGVFE